MQKKDKETLRKGTISSLIVILSCFALAGFFVYLHWDTVSNPEKVQEIITSFGIWAPIVFMTAEAIQVVFPYLPGQLLSVASGYIFGVWLGTFYNLIGVCVGSLLAFFIARKVGRPIVEHLFSKESLDKFDHFFHKHGLIIIFVCRTQFYMPNDLVSYGSGLAKRLSWKKYLAVTFVGFIPHFLLLTSVGAELQTGIFSLRMASYTLLMILMVTIYYFRAPIYRYIHKEEEHLQEWLEHTFGNKQTKKTAVKKKQKRRSPKSA